MKALFIFIILCIVFQSNAHAADNEGKFAGKGAARKDCSAFISTAKDRTSDYLLYGGWLEGYYTAYNQFQTDNYDITPWQTTELLLVLIQQHCELNPDVKFLDAANAMIKVFFPIRLKEENRVIKINVGKTSSYFYEEILLRAKERLKILGFYEGDVSGSEFTKEDIAAFISFQKKVGITESGIPDQQTLTALFLKPNK